MVLSFLACENWAYIISMTNIKLMSLRVLYFLSPTIGIAFRLYLQS